jgi:hypothetical protein
MLILIALPSSRPVNAAPVNWLPWMPFCLSSWHARLVYLLSMVTDQGEHLASDVAFQAADDLQL